MRPGVLRPQRSRRVHELDLYHQVPQRRMPTMLGAAARPRSRSGALRGASKSCLVEALHGLVLVVLAAFQQVMRGHGAAVVAGSSG